MRMKFKSTTLTPKALLYKRFIALEKSATLNCVYKTFDNALWGFDCVNSIFYSIDSDLVPNGANIVEINTSSKYLQYLNTYFYYDATEGWVSTTTLPSGVTLLSAKFDNVAKYQLNKYYYVGSFDYMLKGSISGTTTQFIKGNIIPLTSLNIKYYNDDLEVSVDDLVVINNRLYSVENPEEDHKHQPKDYTVYFATLNSVL